MANPFKPQLRLTIQASVPISTADEGDAEYKNLKVFLLAISRNITLNGQITKMLEPCCKEQRESKANEKSP